MERRSHLRLVNSLIPTLIREIRSLLLWRFLVKLHRLAIPPLFPVQAQRLQSALSPALSLPLHFHAKPIEVRFPPTLRARRIEDEASQRRLRDPRAALEAARKSGSQRFPNNPSGRAAASSAQIVADYRSTPPLNNPPAGSPHFAPRLARVLRTPGLTLPYRYTADDH